jgi:uncharacterized membrane-anchored protein YhcB (DUF1043 family)
MNTCDIASRLHEIDISLSVIIGIMIGVIAARVIASILFK